MKRLLSFVVLSFLASACSSVSTANELEVRATTSPPPAPTIVKSTATVEPVELHALPQQQYEFRPRGSRPIWRQGQAYLQGYIGVGFLDELTRTGGDDDDVEADFSTYPAIGGGGQWKLAGDRIDWGLEALLAFGGRADAAAFAFGGGGGTIAVRIDMLLVDVYGGPFVSTFIGDKVRVYGSVGPLMQWASYAQSDGLSGSGTGFGVGYYARTGIEFLINPQMLMGIGARWAESEINLGNGLGDVDVRGSQVFLTITRGF